MCLCSAQTTLQLASNSAHKALAILSPARRPAAHLHLRCELASLQLAACELASLQSPTLRASTLQAAVRCLVEGREALGGAWESDAGREAAEKDVCETLKQALRGWTQVRGLI